MLNLFRKKEPVCPVSTETREWMEQAFAWFAMEFGDELIKSKEVLIPDYSSFPIIFNGEQQSAIEVLQIVAKQMDVNPDDIFLKFYSEGITEIESGGMAGGKVFIDHEKDAKLSSGLYHGRNEDGKFCISLEEKNLKDPEGIVSTLSHEIAHIKLLGENRIEKNNEPLTDMLTIIYGLGIFNANTAFRFGSGFDQWGYNKLGYLTQIQWGYALAIHSYLRGESNPTWIKHLTATVKGNFIRSIEFINANKDKLLF